MKPLVYASLSEVIKLERMYVIRIWKDNENIPFAIPI